MDCSPLLLLLLLFVVQLPQQTSYAWQQWAHLDDEGIMTMFWTADINKNVLLIEIHGRTQGYLGLGISPRGTMAGADIMVGFVNHQGMPFLVDYWSAKNGLLVQDESQDWKLLTGRQNTTHTMLRVRRPITTPKENDRSVADWPTWIIWSWHTDDPAPHSLPLYHGNRRGATVLCLLRPNCYPPDEPDEPEVSGAPPLLIRRTGPDPRLLLPLLLVAALAAAW